MKLKPNPLSLAVVAALSPLCAVAAEVQALPELTVHESRPALLADNPSPASSVTAEQIQEINTINVEDALKFQPSLFIRKRYVGDRNGIIASRTAGSLTSAASLVYADGLLLSNLLGNSFNFPPRWNIVGAEEIDTIEVLQGPFSALLPGNSYGATVLMATRRPEQFEAHARVQGFTQDFKHYGTDATYQGHQEQAMLGSRSGKLTWSLLANHLDSHSQPINFATAAQSTNTSVVGLPVVSGGIAYNDPSKAPRMMFGATSLDHTVQDTAKLRLAYDFTPDTRAALTYAFWRNDSFSDTDSYLRDAAGNPVWSGNVNIGGTRYSVSGLSPSASTTENQLLGLTLDSRLTPDWSLELSASDYQTPKDISNSTSVAKPAALSGGAGTISFADGTGWQTFDARAVWKPRAGKAGHAVTFGYHHDRYHIESRQYAASNWLDDASVTAQQGSYAGDTQTDAVFAQDVWKLDPRWTLTLGLRHENWQALDGRQTNITPFNPPSGPAVTSYDYPSREASFDSPKLSLAWQADRDWLIRGSLARAYRMPTVSELFQTETRGGTRYISDPNLKPEKILASDLSAERSLGKGSLRLSLFDQHIDDALYSQTDVSVTPNVTSVQNIGRVRISGVEAVYEAHDWLVQGLDLSGSLTWSDSEILSNPGSPNTVGKKVPRIPDWRAAILATYRLNEHWSGSLGVRYSGLQFGRLDNADTNHDDTGSLGAYTVVDVKAGYRFGKLVKASLGIDNLTNRNYFVGPHPFPHRTYQAELRIDY